MNQIHIENLTVNACHGVFYFEKVTPQPFVFDCLIDYDFEKAGITDELKYTLHYGEVMQDIYDFATSKTFDLIETLCYRTAEMLMQKYPIEKITLKVKKPKAPVELDFENVYVCITLEKTRVLLSLGSNMGDRYATLDFAINELKKHHAIDVKKVSSHLENPPYGGVAQLPFVNIAVEIYTYLSPQTLLDYIHKIEAMAHRERTIRWGDRTLDIDIVFYGDKIIDNELLTIPHSDYKNRDFVLIPLNEIAPNFVCPICHKRIKEILADYMAKQNKNC